MVDLLSGFSSILVCHSTSLVTLAKYNDTLDAAQFLGEMAIPLALILLGASFARLKIPRPISRLPIAAMLAVTFAKMILLPVIGVFMVQGMVKGGMIHGNAKVEKFVAMFLSGSPAAIK